MSGFEDYSEFLTVDHLDQIRKKSNSGKMHSYEGSSYEKNFTPASIDAMLKKKF